MQLMALANALYDAIFSGDREGHLDSIFDRLVRFTETHFAAEEEMFRLSGYPDAENHTASHEMLKTQVQEFRTHLGNVDRTLLAIEVTKFLKRWFEEHIQTEDKDFGRFLNAKGVR